MSDDYLWDKSGRPDPDVEALECALSPLRHRETSGVAAPLDAALDAPRALPVRPRRSRTVVAVVLALAASFAIGGAVVWSTRAPHDASKEAGSIAPTATSPFSVPSLPDDHAWFGVTALAGVPQCGNQWMAGDCQLRVGEWLETGEGASAQIAIAEIGQVRVDPGSRVRLSATGPSQHRLELARGRIQAKVDAPPRLFQVTTPAATAVDLGCAYALEVGEGGDGWLSVSSGYVSLEWNKRTSLVAAGARCEMKRDRGPGTPFFDDARAALRTAIHAFDFEGGGESAVVTVLREARPRDSLTLWHLLFRVDAPVRGRVVERLKKLVPPPAGMTDADAMAPDAERLQGWKERMVKTWLLGAPREHDRLARVVGVVQNGDRVADLGATVATHLDLRHEAL